MKFHIFTLNFVAQQQQQWLATDWLTDNWSVSNSSSVHVFEPFFWTRQLLDNFRLKARAIFSRIDF